MDELLFNLCRNFTYEKGEEIWKDFYEYFYTIRQLDADELTNEEILAQGLRIVDQLYL